MRSSAIIGAILLIGVIYTTKAGRAKKSQRGGSLDLYFKFKDHFERQTTTSDLVSLPFTRETYLYSRAARGYLQIVGRKINANGRRRSHYARFLVESDNFGRVRFKGIHSGRYLCMTKTGKLIAKADRRRKGKRSKKDRRGKKKRFGKEKKMRRCVFKEVFGKKAYISFQSTSNTSWYLAMDKNGQPRKGPQAKAGTKSVHFIERPIGVKRDSMSLSERSRPRPSGRKSKRNKQREFQKSERSWPLGPENNDISADIITRYIKQFKKRKNTLKRVIASLKKLRRSVLVATKAKDSETRTRSLAKYSQELKSVLAQLAKDAN